MTHNELCEKILQAMENMEDLRAVPKTIWLSPSAFNTLVDGSITRPHIFGLRVKVSDLPLWPYGFAITQEDEE